MASASSTSARSLFVESKNRLADRIQVNINNISSLARQIQRGSKSNEILMNSARTFAQQEQGFENAEVNLKKLALISTHLEFQLNAIEECSAKLEEVTEQVRAMQR
ncbi:BLOC-1-related complex subunit 7 [Copidosoma floridanum]|uniref:BLOC-1-related complex subunit 7 n=1 Tax=Copidosoma floridanum TaxID=29053 RepID=UPI0006C9E426|nr:BLOC-1-related complex subunit 7 [Copidosoma floridanum]